MAKAQDISDQAAAQTFWRLIEHLQHRTDVQNVDLMGLAGFCRNCLADWLTEAAANVSDTPIDKEAAREVVYGMPYGEWKDMFQGEATPAQLDRMRQSVALNKPGSPQS